MTDDEFDAQVGAWLREAARPDPTTLETVRGSIDRLPGRRRDGRRGWLAIAAAGVVVAVVGLSAIASSLPNGAAPTGSPVPTPPDPAAFAGDPRMAGCFATAGPVEYAFELPRARDYQRHLPAMLLAPELDVDDPAFVVVFASGAQLPFGGSPDPSGSATSRSVCILVRDTPNLYEHVDISGMAVSVASVAPSPTDSPAPASSAPAPTSAVGTPADPARFADDPRFRACVGSGDLGAAMYAFEVARARDLYQFIPAFGDRDPMLDTDASAFVVVLRDQRFRRGGAAPAPGTTSPPMPTYRWDERDVCVLIGPVDGGSRLDYGRVSIVGFDPSSIPSPGPTVAPAPSWTADLKGQLECDGRPTNIGAETGRFYGDAGSPDSPGAALERFLASTEFTGFPTGRYVLADQEGHYARFIYSVEGKVKAVIVLQDEGPDQEPGFWMPTGLRACDASEFGPEAVDPDTTIWLDRDGDRVAQSSVREAQGAEHCGWQSTTWLWVNGILYIRDPLGLLRDYTVGPFDGDASLPPAAESTGYHEGGRTIWRTQDGGAIWVVSGDVIEQWPAASADLGCA